MIWMCMTWLLLGLFVVMVVRYVGRRQMYDELEKRLKFAKDSMCTWATEWAQEKQKVLTLNREIEEWKTGYWNDVKRSTQKANDDIAKIKSLESRIALAADANAEMALSVQVAEQAYAALYSACQAKQGKAKRSHKNGEKSCQSKS